MQHAVRSDMLLDEMSETLSAGAHSSAAAALMKRSDDETCRIYSSYSARMRCYARRYTIDMRDGVLVLMLLREERRDIVVKQRELMLR